MANPATEHFCYTDGACKKSENSPGGWGVLLRHPDGTEVELYGAAIKATSAAMELTAILEALRSLPSGARATVFSDSRSALDVCERRLGIWRKSGWSKVDPEIRQLVIAIDRELTERKPVIRWQWVRGHNGNAGNERANELAAKGAREAKARLREVAEAD